MYTEYNEHMHNLGVCQSNNTSSDGPFKVKGSSLRAAYFFTGVSIAGNGSQG